MTTSYRIHYPRGKALANFRERPAASLLTVPGAALYGAVSGAVRRYRLSGRRRVEGPTIVSVGNIEVGGNGKTPFALRLIADLRERGQRPVYVSRGFMSAAEKMSVVTVVWPSDRTPVAHMPVSVRFIRADEPDLYYEVGDEGAMVAAASPSTPLFFSSDRERAMEVAHEVYRPTHIILDDAFQRWSAGRDVDIVLLDSEHPFGNGRLIPAGTLRERPAALSRATFVGINGVSESTDLPDYEKRVSEACERRVPVFGVSRTLAVINPSDGRGIESAGHAAALSAIARPVSFEAALQRSGMTLAASFRFPDHHRYTARDLDYVARELSTVGVDSVVTTDKDWVKLRGAGVPFNVLVARLAMNVVGCDIGELTKKPQAMPAARS
ncbi:MAG: tetraacyldisaccharide 4'-kinase [bacterium]|nr:tetraacyldisaccharide 4'-kinase [bacterium]